MKITGKTQSLKCLKCGSMSFSLLAENDELKGVMCTNCKKLEDFQDLFSVVLVDPEEEEGDYE